MPKQSNFSQWPESFKDACFTVYREKVAGVGALPAGMTQAEEATKVNEIMQVFLDNAEQVSLAADDSDQAAANAGDLAITGAS